VPVGPHPQPWPDDTRLDPELLAHGDARNVVDGYRYWTVEAIVADLDTRRSPLHVAIENLEHDLNIGSIVRTANAFNVAGVHVVGRRRWNRRGAMVTDAYLSITHHPDPLDLQDWATAHALPILAIDVVPGAIPIDEYEMPLACVLLFGQEGPGLSQQAIAGSDAVLSISQYGSTRSINVAAAAAIAMHSWARTHLGRAGHEAG
jgi:tRNA G18 (ribose-2'-O)-methylase SpoU